MNTWTICQKELHSYFRSPIAYVVMTIYALITGYFTWIGVTAFMFQSVTLAAQGQSMPMNVNDMVIRNVLSNTAVIGLFLIPAISMRLFAEEKRSGTIELLVTSPVHDLEIIGGKWLAALLLFLAMLGITLVDMAVLFIYGQPDWRPMAAGFLGLILFGGTLLAIGTFISSCTKNQIVAAAVSFAAGLMLWVLEWSSQFGSSTVGKVLAYLSVLSHFDSFSRGVIDSKDVIYYISMIALGLFLTARSMESMRWKA